MKEYFVLLAFSIHGKLKTVYPGAIVKLSDEDAANPLRDGWICDLKDAPKKVKEKKNMVIDDDQKSIKV